MTPDVFIFSLGNMRACYPNSTQLVTVYDSPTDAPDRYVARLTMLQKGIAEATNVYLITKHLSEIQELMPSAAYHWLPRDPKDEPHILGVWI